MTIREVAMSLEHIYEVLQRVSAQGLLPAFFIGVLATIAVEAMLGSILWAWLGRTYRATSRDRRRDLEQARREADDLRSRVAALSIEVQEHKARVRDGDGERRRIQELFIKLDADQRALKDLCARERRDRIEAEEQGRLLVEQIQAIQTSDHRIWDREPTLPIPAFRALTRRHMPIVAVLNLKGGVGKTTTTANLGVTLAGLGHRTLLIDADYQGSLSSLVLDGQFKQVRESHRLLDRILEKDRPEDRITSLLQCVTDVADLDQGRGAASFRIVAADDMLEPLEARLMMQWHTGALGDDVRFRLRSALHDDRISESHDLVLIDCPPRLTTACVNALAASDYVLIPVMLNPISADATLRLLGWLRKLMPGLCPDLDLLGIVGNRAFPREKLVEREKAIWKNLEGYAKDAWGEPVRLFEESIIRDHPTISHRLAALDPKHTEGYEALAQSILKEMPAHARRRPQTVS
jgi:cellulose biosynthesis protein BcsQ